MKNQVSLKEEISQDREAGPEADATAAQSPRPGAKVRGTGQAQAASSTKGLGGDGQGGPWVPPPRPGSRKPVVVCVLGAVAVLAVFAALFVIWDLIQAHFLPTLSTGLRHALLTIQAGLVTVLASALVFLFMRQQQRRLSATAERLTRMLEAYAADPSSAGRFDNPHRIHCREVLSCTRTECPMYDAPGERCWQVVALGHADRGPGSPTVTIHQCHDCAVYRESCPDKLTELGEGFNSLMFLLEEDARQLGRIRAQMVEREKMAAVGQLAAGIAHEVGNPLSSISSVVQMIKRGRASGQYSDQLSLIQTHIDRISTIVRQLVSLARPTNERWERTYIGQTLAEAVQLVGFDRRAGAVKIDFKMPKSLPPTYALRSQLQQVFINLALNALDAMPDGGTLTIRAAKKGRDLVVVVEDTGCGISSDTGRRVLEPFFTTKEPGRGTGLGLAVSYGIVRKHGGSIDFQSAVNKGTMFTVSLPILNEPPDHEHGTDNSTAG